MTSLLSEETVPCSGVELGLTWVLNNVLWDLEKNSWGLINVTHKDSARMNWLLSAHIVAQYSDALRALTQVQTGTWSEQHRDMTFSGRKHDHEDLHKFTLFLQQHSPFCQADKTSFVNIATGFVADCRVNTDQAITIGWNVHSNLTGQRFGGVSLRKADQATTFKYMRKPVKIQNENMYMSSLENVSAFAVNSAHCWAAWYNSPQPWAGSCISTGRPHFETNGYQLFQLKDNLAQLYTMVQRFSIAYHGQKLESICS